MRKKVNLDASETIKKQTELALQYLEKASTLITYKKLVPVDKKQIDDYVENTGKIFPPDYRYWLTNYGSGRIEFLSRVLYITSVYELFDYDSDAPLSWEGPANSWKRIFIGGSGPPSVEALDTTIIDEAGCCPVIINKPYTAEVEEVYASS